jgi:hypothetical protein
MTSLQNAKWRRFKRLLTPDGFALAPLWVQLGAIFILSAAIILLLSPLIGSLPLSYRIFFDPSAYADADGPQALAFGLVQVVLSLVLVSSIISVLTAALEQMIEKIKGGTLAYRKSGHLLIVNYNAKLPLILDEINVRAERMGRMEDVVMLFPDTETVEHFCEQLDFSRWHALNIYVRQGDLLSFDTYRRLSILKAMGVAVLSRNGDDEDAFGCDNWNLKIVSALMNESEFVEHLKQRQAEWRPVKCSVEMTGHLNSREIAYSITTVDRISYFAVITPAHVIGSVLSRSMVDLAYYKAYFETLSFHGHSVQFVNPAQFPGLATGVPYDQMTLGFSGGTLVGFSGTDEEGQFQLRLCPFGEPMRATDWLLFITDNVSGLRHQPVQSASSGPHPGISPPSEIVSRRLCVLGSSLPLDNMLGFLDAESCEAARTSHFIFENEENYFSREFIERLRQSKYDNVVINLKDDMGFRLTLMILSLYDKDDPFIGKIVTVLNDPLIEGLLNKNNKYQNTVVSHKLTAKYIAQLAFQKNLEKFFAELAMPEGVEFNLMEVDKHIPRALLTDVDAVRRHLVSHKITYIGTVDKHKQVVFGSEDFSGAHQLLILSSGDG